MTVNERRNWEGFTAYQGEVDEEGRNRAVSEQNVECAIFVLAQAAEEVNRVLTHHPKDTLLYTAFVHAIVTLFEHWQIWNVDSGEPVDLNVLQMLSSLSLEVDQWIVNQIGDADIAQFLVKG